MNERDKLLESCITLLQVGDVICVYGRWVKGNLNKYRVYAKITSISETSISFKLFEINKMEFIDFEIPKNIIQFENIDKLLLACDITVN